MARIMWFSVSPLIPTGYGTQTALICSALKAAGHEVAISCTVGLQGYSGSWNGIRLFPHSGYHGAYGGDVVGSHAKQFKPDLIISWMDAFVLPTKEMANWNWAAWVPVDSDPLMTRNVEPLKATKWQLGPTPFAVDMMRAAGMKNTHLMPCAFDPSVFHPYACREDVRREFGKSIDFDLKPSTFLVNVVSANSSTRKNFPAVFDAWRRFHQLVPDSLLYLHTDMTGYFNQGEDLAGLMKLFDVDEASVRFVNQYTYNAGAIQPEYLALAYNAADVHLNCCYGEGFGLPLLDAQACGCPVIAPNFAAAPYVVKHHKYNGLCAGALRVTVPGARQMEVDVGDVIVQLYEKWEQRAAGPIPRHGISAAVAKSRIHDIMNEHVEPLIKLMCPL